MTKPRVAMIGLDGMSWHILKKLFKWGVMPNLRGIAEKSMKGVLRSTIPPESAPSWTSIATGVNPGKHGIFGFTRLTDDYKNTTIATSRDVKYLRIHEMVAAQGLKSICVNQLLTYPIKGFEGSSVITDWLSPVIKYSPEIGEYAQEYRGPTLSENLPLLRKDWIGEYADVSSRVNTVNNLLQKVDWNLFWAVYSEPDHLLHRYSRMVMKRDTKLMRLLTKIDETFGVVRNVADLLIIASDHGFNEFKYGVYINTYLERQGLAFGVQRQAMKDIACQRQVREQRVAFSLPGAFRKYLSFFPGPVELALLEMYRQLLRVDIRLQLRRFVDPKSSKAFAQGFGVYVKEKKWVDHVADMLTQTDFIGDVWRREELYEGNQIAAMPDLIIVPNFEKGFALHGDVISPKPVVRRNFYSHDPYGIVIIHKTGSGRIESGKGWLKTTSAFDIVPTILSFLGLEVPSDTDGEIIEFDGY